MDAHFYELFLQKGLKYLKVESMIFMILEIERCGGFLSGLSNYCQSNVKSHNIDLTKIKLFSYVSFKK
jgi:hypothetical protein